MAFFADYYNLVTFWETEEFFFGHATHFKENDCVYRYCHDEGDQGCNSSSDEGVSTKCTAHAKIAITAPAIDGITKVLRLS